MQLAFRKASVGGEGKSKGTGEGRLISPSALPLPGILFCLFLSLSFGTDPVHKITAEIYSVQDTRGL